MKRFPRPRETANLCESIHQQLNMYALAAGAAGAGMLALALPAEGKIVYTPTHRVIAPRHSYNIDLNHDKIIDFTIANSVSACTDLCFYELRQKPAGGNRAIGYGSASQILLDSALNPGARIGPRSPFKKGTAALVVARANYYTSNATIVYGPWANVKDRYLGLEFKIKGKIHYGWARLSVTVSKTTITATLTGYAYETIANKPIITGRTKGPDDGSVEESNAALNVPTSKPATLGLLAMGSSGLSMWRR
jgi:hypothetical protein